MMQRYVDVFLSPSTQHYFTNNTMVGIWWRQLSSYFWHSHFWLPSGIEWEDIAPTEELKYPNFQDVLVYPLLLSVVFISLNFLLEPFIFGPLARAADIPNKRPCPPPPSKILERLYYRHGMKLPEKALLEACSSTDMTVRQVERWLRRRYVATQTSKYDKFVECGFNVISHIVLTTYGVSIMVSKPWLWDISNCWENYPYHYIDDDVWWYYTIGLAYFWSATFLQILGPGRSVFDKMQMMLHHVFTILLMVFSWTCNFVRIGTLVLLVHECADIPLLIAKMLVYANRKFLTDAIFVIFLISWVITRNYLYPFWIMRSAFFDSQGYTKMPAAYLLKSLLCGLLLLNVVWTVLIGGVLVKKLRAGSIEDVRSDGEDLSEDNIKNGTKTE